jgi:hypothetical protein
VSADILSCMVTRRQHRRRLAVESASLGLGYTAGFIAFAVAEPEPEPEPAADREKAEATVS